MSDNIATLLNAVNPIKSELIRLSDRIREIDPTAADDLDDIIGSLENWQHQQ